MDSWGEPGGGGGFFDEVVEAPATGYTSKPSSRQQYMWPVTIRQVLEAPDDGLSAGSSSASMVTVVGVVLAVHSASTNTQFTLADDTGVVHCLDWLESEDGEVIKERVRLMEGLYYQVHGCIKSPHGKRRLMVFKMVLIEDFNMMNAFIAEVLSVNRFAEKMNQGYVPMETSTSVQPTALHNFGNTVTDSKQKLTLPQRDVLDAVMAVAGQIGWDKNDPHLRQKYSAQQIDNIIEFLVGEGYIYSTVDEDHYSPT